ncbi:hypothetical protein F5144DRAFT_589499 [Chaetomium tenue]|uniref:Uncharacterized protein n=1 Tax=Chaetomium tenue TaxID=1854479 RepID=A0ACB7PS18_9PEZI|nr:hypothetical protein F5144DRAFT_589499 [Chaetomium globosum]
MILQALHLMRFASLPGLCRLTVIFFIDATRVILCLDKARHRHHGIEDRDTPPDEKKKTLASLFRSNGVAAHLVSHLHYRDVINASCLVFKSNVKVPRTTQHMVDCYAICTGCYLLRGAGQPAPLLATLHPGNLAVQRASCPDSAMASLWGPGKIPLCLHCSSLDTDQITAIREERETKSLRMGTSLRRRIYCAKCAKALPGNRKRWWQYDCGPGGLKHSHECHWVGHSIKNTTASAFATSSESSSSHVTNSPSIPRERIGPAKLHLRDELLKMYWDGVRREIPPILLTLKKWQRHYANVTLPVEKDRHVHGYDTFLDSVSHTSRQFTHRYESTHKQSEEVQGGGDNPPSYTEALADRGWDIFAELKSSNMRGEIRAALASEDDSEDTPRIRARMLLQSAQFLDIDKVIEYRAPEKLFSFWKRPPTPQMSAESYDGTNMPVFSYLTCFDCCAIIRGSMFRNLQDAEITVCEQCYIDKHYGQASFTKLHKQSCLDAAVPPKVASSICQCVGVKKRDNTGKTRTLFPIDEAQDGSKHLNEDGKIGRPRCGLFELTEMVAEAKYAATRLKADTSRTLGDERRERDVERQKIEEKKAAEAARFQWGFKKPEKVRNPNALQLEATLGEFGTSYGFTTSNHEDIPFYLRSMTDNIPWGNTHLALRFGPLVIENGVAHTMRGALITSRDPQNLQPFHVPSSSIQHSLIVSGQDERILYSHNRPRSVKRYKAMMKQVVGGAFCNFFDPASEDTLIDMFLAESERVENEGLSVADKGKLMDGAVERLMPSLKKYLVLRVEDVIDSLVSRLLEVDLKWHPENNNCQSFCDGLIDRALFGPLVSPDKKYLMSFVCRPGAYIKEKTRSKYDVPNGLTEEYLLKFHYGRHDESDIIDTLTEYWYDWGAFGGPLYPYQDLFPWDCTEAYQRYPGVCGDCNISKHVWAFPFDSWSIISLHLSRSRYLYPRDSHPDSQSPSLLNHTHPNPPPDQPHPTTGTMTDPSWFRNRLTLLTAQDALLRAATAMAQSPRFHESTLWLHQQDDAKLDRLKLGGIHRAQPFSHHFEKGEYHLYFAAAWSHLARGRRVQAYERLRDWKATRRDMKSDAGSDDSDGGCGGVKDLK